MQCIMISLVGEQPVPNVLPVRYYQQEQTVLVVLVYTERTEQVAKRLAALLPGACLVGPVDPYSLEGVEDTLRIWFDQHDPDGEEVVFNITGGTKPMMLSAYRMAERQGRTLVYVQTEGKAIRLYRYQFRHMMYLVSEPEIIELPTLLTIDDYLRVHSGSFTATGYAKHDGGAFEEAVDKALVGAVDESIAGVKLGGAQDADLVIRTGNRVGIVEIKTGNPNKKGIDQLNTLGGREYLGTYTSKFLIVDRSWQEQTNLRDLAAARQITLVELPSYEQTGGISDEDRQKLVHAVASVMG